jgi:sugar lactone lactonase YvrE
MTSGTQSKWFISCLVATLLMVSCSGRGRETLVSTVAGSTGGYADGKGAQAQFNGPVDIAIDDQGNIYVADTANHTVRVIAPDGTVTTLAGDPTDTAYLDGIGAAARFSSLTGIDVGPDGIIYIADSVEMDPHPMRLRKVTVDGVVTTLAGGSEAGSKDGKGAEAFFRTPANLTLDKDGNVYIADTNNHRIRKVTPDGMVSTIAGPVDPGLHSGYMDGLAADALFKEPRGLAVDDSGNIYLADSGNHCIRKISTDGMVSTLAGSKEAGYADGQGSAARFNYPTDVAVDDAGNVFVADSANHRIRMITPEGVVSTLAGNGIPGFKDGPALEAQFRLPQGIEIDSKGNLYIADTANNLIRKITR